MYLDKPKDECGVFGIYNNENAIKLTVDGLFALQHRGEESAGIVGVTKNTMYMLKGMGLINEISKRKEIDYLKGNSAIGHVRYSLIGESNVANSQPFAMDKGSAPDQTIDKKEIIYTDLFIQKYKNNPLALAQNGNFLGGLEGICNNESDTKTFSRMLSKSNKDTKDAVLDLLQRVQGSYALVIITKDMLIGARDPEGYRLLSLGCLDNSFVISSESCAFNHIKAEFIRDINAGEVLIIDKNGLHSEYIYKEKPPKRKECIFEHVYLSRSDSLVFGKSVREFRLEIGHILGKEKPVNADIVMGIPDAGNMYARGYAEELGIPYEPDGLVRDHYYPGRVFLQPEHKSRLIGSELKFFAVPEAVKGKRIALIDDSKVRGVNAMAAVKKLKQAGAKEVHLRVASPPYIEACQWGVDTYDLSKLIARNKSEQEIIAELGIDSLGYLSLEKLLSVFDGPEHKCTHCFER